jgi:hypothetical protein
MRRAEPYTCRVCLTWARVGLEESTNVSGGELMPTTSDATKEQLYKEAKRLGIKGRSKMRKGALKAAIERRRGH